MALIPTSKKVVIGIRNPQERVIYPLSWHDMKKIQELFFAIMTGAVNLSDSGYSQEQVYQYILMRISENIGDLLAMVVDGEPVDEKELSLEQVAALASVIFEMNFEGISKNVKSLLQKVEMLNLKKAVSR